MLEERAADAAADPVGLDPEILEPPDQAAGDQRRPADWISPALGYVDAPLPQTLGLEGARIGPFLDPRKLVTPVRLRCDRDLAQSLEFIGPPFTDANRVPLEPGPAHWLAMVAKAPGNTSLEERKALSGPLAEAGQL